LFKSGFTGIIGRPNVGKSTLLNRIVGEKIAISTPKPQTTRNRIMGIRNMEGAQLVFLDTPGIHRPSTLLNQYMVNTALNTFGDNDLLLLVVEADAGCQNGDQFVINTVKDVKIPVILVINKIDLVEKTKLLPLIDRCRELFPFAAIIPVSALNGDGIVSLLDEICKLLPEGPRYFPEDVMTDRSERFIAAEIIREKITMLTHQEIPYATAVVVDYFKEESRKNLLRIGATIQVEKDSQKGIMIGKKGAMLKKIGTEARLSLEKFFVTRVFLELFVHVRKDWTGDAKILKEFGYGDKSW
jgi:GTP-binding protein Era